MPHVTLALNDADLLPGDHIRALLFDWDGTLFDNHHFNYLALAHGMRVHGIDITEDWFHENSGFSARGIVEEARRAAGSSAAVGEILRERDVYANSRLHEIPVVAPVHALLRAPGERRVGVVTGSNRSNIEGLLRLHGLEACLDALVTRDELHRGKPSPEGYLLAMQRIGIADGREVLVYEDSDQGIEAALQAGADAIDVRPLMKPHRWTERPARAPSMSKQA